MPQSGLSSLVFSAMGNKKAETKESKKEGAGSTRSGKNYQPVQSAQRSTGDEAQSAGQVQLSAGQVATERCEEATAASVEPPVIPRVEQDTSEPPLTTARILLHAGYDTAGP